MPQRLLFGTSCAPTRPTIVLRALAGALWLVLAGLAACGGGDLALPSQGDPSQITVVRGNRQSGTIGEPLADSLVVKVVDRFGDPVAGSTITWSPEVGGGSVNPPTSVTSAQGMAATQRVLGSD